MSKPAIVICRPRSLKKPSKQAKAKSKGTASPPINKVGARSHDIERTERAITNAMMQAGDTAPAKEITVGPTGSGEGVSIRYPMTKLPTSDPTVKQMTAKRP
ncbi:hypothetical protein PQBR44_0162 (plasmid) [Pseudomonas putida UWC1]|nr:hypothetical protein PQBR44_0162 [Pseudomonas putida UWC1]